MVRYTYSRAGVTVIDAYQNSNTAVVIQRYLAVIMGLFLQPKCTECLYDQDRKAHGVP